MKAFIVVPWHRQEELMAFCTAWNIKSGCIPEWLIFQHDAQREGCGVTKNKGILKAMDFGADVIIVLDGDCYPSHEVGTLMDLIDAHIDALKPQRVQLYQAVTDPPSRGTPYFALTVEMPVAASMGFWLNVPDYCAVRQLAYNAKPMDFSRTTIFQRYFALCGMNIAFRPSEWLPWCQFIDVPRFDDIWMGWLWQKEAYRRGHCFNLNGPLITHARQSNVWSNLIDEAVHLKATETLWSTIALCKDESYESLRKLLPT